VHTRSGSWPKVFHTDRGGEFLNPKLEEFWKQIGTYQSPALPYSAPQNGRAERIGRRLVEMVRTMMIAAGAPHVLWGEAFLAAAYLHNIITVCEGKTAYQLFWNRLEPPTVSHCHVWGCDAFVHVPVTSKLKKLDPVSSRMSFVGYEENLGWRFIDREGRVHCTKHARFVDDSFCAMKSLRESIDSSGGPPESDDDFFGRMAESNEIRLAEQLSRDELGLSDDSASKEGDGQRRSARQPKQFMRYGMVDPDDIGEALSADSAITVGLDELETPQVMDLGELVDNWR
jgi:hypothetical protein